MSRVYKGSEVTLGREKLIKLPTNPIIKARTENISEEPAVEERPIEDDKTPEKIIEEARIQASELLEAARQEANKIIHNANTEKEAIISEAYTESNQILENAREEGYKQGLMEGRNIGLKEMDSLIEEAKMIKQNTIEEKKRVAKELEGQLIDLVISCVEKIIDHELEKDRDLLLNLIKKGIEKCVYTESLIIRVSVDDYEVVNGSKNKIFIMTEGIDHIEVKKDPALSRGDLFIETASGTVDASIKTQIDQIQQVFSDILKGEI